MLWINIKRIIRSGFFSFWRKGFISLSAVLVMIVTLFVIGSTIFSGAILGTVMQEIKDKVNINVYFVNNAPEDQILALKQNLEQLPEVVPPVVYISADDVLAQFKIRHQDDTLTLQSLDELGTNPFGAILNVKTKELTQYQDIANFLGLTGSDCSSFESKFPIVSKVNYCNNKDAINNLANIINSANSIGFALTAFLIIISVLITFNTIRLVIYMSKDEISVMRLVGASTGYIRGPFIVAGTIYGFLSAIVTLILFYPMTIWLSGKTKDFFLGFDVFHYYTSNFGQIFLIVVLSGIIIGSVSSYLAVRKYLKV